ncbi:MAG TPA: PQQ-dependent dehydrogenase, methanol/ethanol family [Gemmatimonadales bacterium]|nr:PQQ-dependent dehydrogenase, methanol/ethanol family [Gemmatimonadales bacterium]
MLWRILTAVTLLLIGDRPAVPDGDWRMPGKDYAATRYSGLGQITAANANRLHLVWNFATGVLGGHEGQPLVVNHTMYVVTPYPNVLYAFDLTQDGYPLRWKYRPDVSPTALGTACCDAVNRGAAYADGKIVYNLLDGHTVAVDATTGKQLWRTKIADMAQGETTPMAPFIVKDRVLVGPSGGEFGIHGWVKALDLNTGRVVWTAYNEGPDSDMIARPGTFRPFYDQGANLGVSSWPPDGWKRAGVPVWGWLTYDPELDLVYFGTGNASPYNAEQRPGDNKWASSVLARRPEDGALVWAYQFTPHESWDFDSNAEMILADLTVHGKPRKVLVHFDKNGFAYTIDRSNGELLVAAPFTPLNWATRVDFTTGRPLVDSTKLTGASRGNIKNICPTLEGGKSPASPSSYSPRTGLFYVSTNNMCMDYEAVPATHIVGTPYIGATTPYHPGAGGYSGAFIAWDAAAGRRVWEIHERYPVWSGSVVTAGDVVFYGTLDGMFKAVDAKSGKPLWQFKLGSGIVGSPISYLGPDGKQYIAICDGIGGDWFLLAGDVRSDDPADVRPPADFIPDIARRTSQGGTVWVFGLGTGP